VVLAILRAYVDRFYRVQHQRWDAKHMVYEALASDDPNFRNYTIKIRRSDQELIRAVTRLINERHRIYSEDTGQPLPNIHFDRHLYQPLLVAASDDVKSDPPGLAPSERAFVTKLKQYVRVEGSTSLANRQVFLLRNLSRGRGVGFFEKEGFYPDFILWIQSGARQRLVFIEPHGMRQSKPYWRDDKVRLHERLKAFGRSVDLPAKSAAVQLDSFIVSATPYEELRQIYGEGNWDRTRFSAAHILFAEEDYVRDLFFETTPPPERVQA